MVDWQKGGKRIPEISEIVLEDIEKLKKHVQHFLRKNLLENS